MILRLAIRAALGLSAIAAGFAGLRRLARAAAPVPDDGSFGQIAEFTDADALIRAVRSAIAAGWTRIEAFGPHPVPDAAEAMGLHAAPVAWIAVAAGLGGAAAAYGLTWFLSVQVYPLNVGGRPPHAWPVFLPAAYIVAVLSAAIAALLGMLWLNRLPRLHHPVFHARGFMRATQDRFFLAIWREDPRYDPDRVAAFLRAQSPLRVSAVRAS
ncbi:MAG TPA: DUF3341 domain-containing protein [Acetobacteraceae bacterium]|nr:DUF3341 domain-containing protein [Acetobacteraceae bacterium]